MIEKTAEEEEEEEVQRVIARMTQAQVDLKRKRDAAMMRKKPTHQKKPMLEEALLSWQQPQQREIQMQIRTETPSPLAMVTPTITTPTITAPINGPVADPDISKDCWTLTTTFNE